MDKFTRNVTIIVAITVAIGAVVLAFFITRSHAQRSATTVPLHIDQNATLISTGTQHIQSMQITNQNQTYTIIPHEQNDSEMDYTIQGVELDDLDGYALQNIVEYGCNPVATGNVGNVENLAKYGLDQPLAAISVLYESGETFDYNIGNAVNAKKDKYYMCVKGSSHVYIITIEPAMLRSLDDLLQKISVGNPE